MKKIAMDIRMFEHSGIGTYIRELLNILLEQTDFEWFFLLDKNKKEKFLDFFSDKNLDNCHFIDLSVPIYSIREQFFFNHILKKLNVDLLHCPHYNAPVFFDKKLLVTVHDLIHIKFSNNPLKIAYAKFILNQVCKNATKIITGSQNTKKDLTQFFDVDQKKIQVIFHGSGQTAPLSQISFSPSEKKYILYVGNIKPYKNVETLIKAFLSAKKDMPKAELVLIGQNFMPELNNRYKNIPEIKFMGKVGNTDLLNFFNHARLFVFPSLYEGFGLPVLEAMTHEIPVLCSNTSSLPEVAGDAAIFFDPKDEKFLSLKMIELWNDSEKRKDLILKGRENIQRFKWEQSAKETINIYREILQ